MTMQDDGQDFLNSDYSRCGAYQRYGQESNWTGTHIDEINILVMPMHLSKSYIVSGDGSATTPAAISGPYDGFTRAQFVIIQNTLYNFKYKNVTCVFLIKYNNFP